MHPIPQEYSYKIKLTPLGLYYKIKTTKHCYKIKLSSRNRSTDLVLSSGGKTTAAP
jgi:hypothetical protein